MDKRTEHMYLQIDKSKLVAIIEFLRPMRIVDLPEESFIDIVHAFKEIEAAIIANDELTNKEANKRFWELYDNYRASLKVLNDTDRESDEWQYRETELYSAREELKYFLADNAWWEGLDFDHTVCNEYYHDFIKRN